MKLLIIALCVIGLFFLTTNILLYSLGTQLSQIHELSQKQYDFEVRANTQQQDQFSNLFRLLTPKPLTKKK